MIIKSRSRRIEGPGPLEWDWHALIYGERPKARRAAVLVSAEKEMST